MTVLEDGSLKCDMCGATNPDTSIKMPKDWTRKTIKAKYGPHPDYLHYCPICSKKMIQ